MLIDNEDEIRREITDSIINELLSMNESKNYVILRKSSLEDMKAGTSTLAKQTNIVPSKTTKPISKIQKLRKPKKKKSKLTTASRTFTNGKDTITIYRRWGKDGQMLKTMKLSNSKGDAQQPWTDVVGFRLPKQLKGSSKEKLRNLLIDNMRNEAKNFIDDEWEEVK